MRWSPHVTVATIVEHLGDFLIVKEPINGKLLYNQPAGHLEAGETLIQAAKRETLEETGWLVDITHYLGMYVYYGKDNGVCYHRHCFIGQAQHAEAPGPLDPDIDSAHWLDYNDIIADPAMLRSPLVKRCLDDYRSGTRYPLSVLHEADQSE